MRDGKKYNPTNPVTAPKGHGRKPPPPPPHRSNGRMCRLGQAVAGLILFYLVAVPVAALAGL